MRVVRRLRRSVPDRHAAGKASCSSARPNTRWSPPAPTAASAARSRPR
jgi:hypothetical protein